MTPKQSVTPTVAEADYESYKAVAKIVSTGLSDAVFRIVGVLTDQDVFTREVRGLAATQGIVPAAMGDPMTLYHGFWTFATGIDSDFRWLSNAGVPVHPVMFARSFPNPVDPSAVPFGAGLGYSW
jgi:hypothetical protein